MIRVEHVKTFNFEGAVRGLRNPMNSWDFSDSGYIASGKRYENVDFVVGDVDLNLMKRLYKAGPEHRKYLRQIFVSLDITAPLYWWKEFDTYKVGTVANSCSTMHKIAAKEFELDDFSHEHLCGTSIDHVEMLIDWLNDCRKSYVEQKHKEDWWQLIQLLPSSYNQKRTITMNYENVITMINQRTGHKLDEWRDFVETLSGLPYVKDICGD